MPSILAFLRQDATEPSTYADTLSELHALFPEANDGN